MSEKCVMQYFVYAFDDNHHDFHLHLIHLHYQIVVVVRNCHDYQYDNFFVWIFCMMDDYLRNYSVERYYQDLFVVLHRRVLLHWIICHYYYQIVTK